MMSSKCQVNIYERQTNVKQLSIDNLPLRTRVNKCTVYYDAPASRKCKSMHACVDKYDQARQLATFARRDTPRREQPCYYYIDIENGRVCKLKEYHGVIKYNQVYHGIKSQAQKKLDRIMSI